MNTLFYPYNEAEVLQAMASSYIKLQFVLWNLLKLGNDRVGYKVQSCITTPFCVMHKNRKNMIAQILFQFLVICQKFIIFQIQAEYNCLWNDWKE